MTFGSSGKSFWKSGPYGFAKDRNNTSLLSYPEQSHPECQRTCKTERYLKTCFGIEKTDWPDRWISAYACKNELSESNNKSDDEEGDPDIV